MRDSAPVGILLLVFALAIAAFLPSIGHGFVYDDHRFFASNPALREASILWRAFADPLAQTADGTHAGLWRPLRTLSFAFDAAVGGGAPWWAHAHNVLLHGAATAVVAALLWRLDFGRAGVVLGAVVYAFHPVQVECVSWISSRGDLLSALLLWTALLVQRPGRAWLAWGLGAAALLAKEQAIVWPALAFLYAWMSGAAPARAARQAVVPAIATGLFVLIRHVVLTEPFQEGGVAAGGAGITELGAMLAHQTWFAILPIGSVFDWQMPGPAVGVGAAALVPLVLLARPQTRAAALWFLVALVPTLFVQAVIPLNIRTADRFLLFALPALALLVASALKRAPRATPAACLAVLCLATLTIDGQRAWESDRALWTRTAARLPGHWRAEAWLGHAALTEGDPSAATVHLRRAVALAPTDAKTRFRLAEALQASAARATGDGVYELTLAARDAYAESWGLFSQGRQENRALLGPLAFIRSCDLSLALGEVALTEAWLKTLVAKGPPVIPAAAAATWNSDVDRLANNVEQFVDPGREDPLAPRIRAWKVQR